MFFVLCLLQVGRFCMPGDTVIDFTTGAGGFSINALMNGCHVISTERNYNQANHFRQRIIHLDSVKYWRSLVQHLHVPEVFMKKNKQDMMDVVSRKKNGKGVPFQEADVRYIPCQALMTVSAPEHSSCGVLPDWCPGRFRTVELMNVAKELHKAWTASRVLRVS